jgi:hypothetical protein
MKLISIPFLVFKVNGALRIAVKALSRLVAARLVGKNKP